MRGASSCTPTISERLTSSPLRCSALCAPYLFCGASSPISAMPPSALRLYGSGRVVRRSITANLQCAAVLCILSPAPYPLGIGACHPLHATQCEQDSHCTVASGRICGLLFLS